MKASLKQHYYWVIVLLVSLEMAVLGGLTNVMNVFIIPICEELGVSRSAYAVTEVPYRIIGAVATMLSVFLYRKIGYRKTAVIALSIVALSYVLTAISRDLVSIGFCRGLLGIGYGMALVTGAVWIVKLWFVKRQGMLIGMVCMFTGFGGSAMTFLLTYLVERFDWRIANFVSAGIVLLVVLSYLLFLRDTPEEMGLKPWGHGSTQPEHKKPKTGSVWAGPPVQDWLHKPLFYIALFFTACSTVSFCLATLVMVPYFQDQGFSPQEAAVFQSTYMLVLAGAKLINGTLSDRIGAKTVAACCIACSGAGHLILGLTANPVLCYLGVSFLGFGVCMTTVLPPLLVPIFFGYVSADTITSILLATISLSSVFTNLISNFGYDRAGSYCPTFVGAAVVNLVMLGVFFGMSVISKKEHRQFELQNEKAV